jgi:hypothetical protein
MLLLPALKYVNYCHTDVSAILPAQLHNSNINSSVIVPVAIKSGIVSNLLNATIKCAKSLKLSPCAMHPAGRYRLLNPNP